MQYFKRIFKYIWPQWHRLIVIVIASIITSALFSVSFMAVGPLLNVMMGQEDLHESVDRKIISLRYDVKFYVPNINDYQDSNNGDVENSLTIVEIGKESPFKKGMHRNDRIIAVGDNQNQVTAANLLDELVYLPDDSAIALRYKRMDKQGKVETGQIELPAKQLPFYKKWAVDMSRKIEKYVPRRQGGDAMGSSVKFILVVVIFLTIIRCTAKIVQEYMANKVVQIAVNRFRQEAFVHIMDVPIKFFSRISASDAMSRILGDVNGIGKGLSFIFGKGLIEPLKALFCVVCALSISPKLVLIFMGGAPVVLGMTGMLGKRTKKYTRRSLKSTAVILGKLEDVVNSLSVVKVYNQQKYENKAFNKVNKEFLKQTLKAAMIEAATMPSLEIVGMFAMAAALLVGVKWVTSSNMETSSFFILIIMLGTAAESVRRTADSWNKLQAAEASSKRVYEIVDEELEKENADGVKLSPLSNEIEFRKVTFTYPNSNSPVLRDIDLKIKAGKTVAFVGPNGSGKTTMINLIPRFYDPDKGSILVDGVNIADATLHSLRDQIGMVTQNIVTFHDTIAANIAYGRADATREQIIDAAKRAFAHDFIEQLPKGYDTVIGENNTGLSGGQLQRIVIARAIIKNPSILIFDEATSQVDADSESKIHNALDNLMKNRTCIMIAHRFSTVISADTIVVMDKGQIRAKGSHDELINSCPLYKTLYETQLLGA